jgi:hypothetical protein
VDLAAEPLEEVHSVPPIEATAEEDEDEEEESIEPEPEEPDEIDLLGEDVDDDV